MNLINFKKHLHTVATADVGDSGNNDSLFKLISASQQKKKQVLKLNLSWIRPLYRGSDVLDIWPEIWVPSMIYIPRIHPLTTYPLASWAAPRAPRSRLPTKTTM